MAECSGIGNGPLYSRNHILDMLSRSMEHLETVEAEPSEGRTLSLSSRQ
jgi:hypothetical protein